MAITQTFLDSQARAALRLVGTTATQGRAETVTVLHRTTRTAAPVTYTGLDALIAGYSERILAEQLALTPETTRIEREDRQLRLATADVSWTPTLADSVERADGSVWRVMALSGGAGQAFWRMRIRRIGG